MCMLQYVVHVFLLALHSQRHSDGHQKLVKMLPAHSYVAVFA